MVNRRFEASDRLDRRRGHRPHLGRDRHLGRCRGPAERFVHQVRGRGPGAGHAGAFPAARRLAGADAGVGRPLRDGPARLPGDQRARHDRYRTRIAWRREAILENASIGIALTRDQRFLMVNPAFEAMLGWPDGSIIGQSGARGLAERGRLRRDRRADRPGTGARRADRGRMPGLPARRQHLPVPHAGACGRPLAPEPRRHDLDRRGHHREAPPGRSAGASARRRRGRQPRQERLPGQHQPRTAHTAERPARPGPAGAHAGAGRSKAHDSTWSRSSTARARWPRSCPTSWTCRRSRPASCRSNRRPSTWVPCCSRCERGYAALASGRGLRLRLQADAGIGHVLGDAAAGAPDAHQLPGQRAEVHRARRRSAACPAGERPAGALRGARHRARHRRRHPGAAVQTLHPGRPVDDAALRRHRSGPVDLPRAGEPDGRRGRRHQPARRRQLLLGRTAAARRRPPRPPRRRRRRTRPRPRARMCCWSTTTWST